MAFNRLDRPSRPGLNRNAGLGSRTRVAAAPTASTAVLGERGELVVRGHNVMKGYIGRPDATDEAIDSGGWFHTGDIATRDEDNFFYIVDRLPKISPCAVDSTSTRARSRRP